MSESGTYKAAVLMLALGEEQAAEVLKHLGPREVQKLGGTMSTMKPLQSTELNTVLHEFNRKSGETTSFGIDNDEYIRSVMTAALGDDKASTLLNRIIGQRDASGIEQLKWMDSQSVADLIYNEHPQIIATILVHLERVHACEVLNCFVERLRHDVMLRIATLDGVQPAALRELNEVLTRLLSGNESVNKKPMGGIRTAAEIMNFFTGDTEMAVVSHLRAYDETMAQEILDEMFVFENIFDIDDRGIQTILKEVQSESLIIALKGTSDQMREKIFKNMSQRAAQMMREDLEAKGPVRLSEVEEKQKEILQIVRRLADEKQIQLGSKGEDAYV
ncbi:flagellar motor switch protein FliG [Noviherbaspirillum pedocola]|uniref:Flagellar motor switch protein FliG n=1 Tax=Noviherbaspirillum pedocola TaxID=2801341 RepID=A0A934T1S3_9BURK|nr:flagellar motor switch protein FliG [Noviherbaspirillum pedocola]MBK4736058.1 flagellar motor switch protein FliG [Noviherbaspirillum pedocola]